MLQLFVLKEISFNTIKNRKKRWHCVRYNFKLQLLFNTILTFTNNITYLAWSYKIEPLASLWHAHKGKQAEKHTKCEYHE